MELKNVDIALLFLLVVALVVAYFAVISQSKSGDNNEKWSQRINDVDLVLTGIIARIVLFIMG